jgi:hypothetical protein
MENIDDIYGYDPCPNNKSGGEFNNVEDFVTLIINNCS